MLEMAFHPHDFAGPGMNSRDRQASVGVRYETILCPELDRIAIKNAGPGYARRIGGHQSSIGRHRLGRS